MSSQALSRKERQRKAAREYARRWRAVPGNLEKKRAEHKAWRDANPDHVRALKRRSHLRVAYGLSEHEAPFIRATKIPPARKSMARRQRVTVDPRVARYSVSLDLACAAVVRS